jgi:hypothetical protein
MSLNRFRHPEGTDLPALERNILKYRGFEMLLLLFYVEELKGMIKHRRIHTRTPNEATIFICLQQMVEERTLGVPMN